MRGLPNGATLRSTNPVGGGDAIRLEFQGSAGRMVADAWYAPDSLGTVLLLHGGGQTRHSWQRTGPWLREAGWTAVTIDARGHGESGWAANRDYSADALVGDLLGIIGELRTRPVLVGASMGGNTALLGEGEHPGLARGLVLVDIVPRLEPTGLMRIREFMRGHPDGFGSLAEVAAAIMDYNPHRTRPPSEAGLLRTVRLGNDGQWRWHWDPAFLGGGDEPTRAERHERICAAARALRVPVMLVRGGESDIVSDDGVGEFLGLVPHARYVNIQAAGHMVAGDDNHVFSAHLLEFLDEVAATP